MFINHHFECKGTKCSNKKTQGNRMDKNKKQELYICSYKALILFQFILFYFILNSKPLNAIKWRSDILSFIVENHCISYLLLYNKPPQAQWYKITKIFIIILTILEADWTQLGGFRSRSLMQLPLNIGCGQSYLKVSWLKYLVGGLLARTLVGAI